jgi:hypothetical protein
MSKLLKKQDNFSVSYSCIVVGEGAKGKRLLKKYTEGINVGAATLKVGNRVICFDAMEVYFSEPERYCGFKDTTKWSSEIYVKTTELLDFYLDGEKNLLLTDLLHPELKVLINMEWDGEPIADKYAENLTFESREIQVKFDGGKVLTLPAKAE